MTPGFQHDKEALHLRLPGIARLEIFCRSADNCSPLISGDSLLIAQCTRIGTTGQAFAAGAAIGRVMV